MVHIVQQDSPVVDIGDRPEHSVASDHPFVEKLGQNQHSNARHGTPLWKSIVRADTRGHRTTDNKVTDKATQSTSPRDKGSLVQAQQLGRKECWASGEHVEGFDNVGRKAADRDLFTVSSLHLFKHVTPNHASSTSNNVATKEWVDNFGKLGKPMTRRNGTPSTIPD
jgi:hypothetical protein